jgi:hypothetical protein
MDCFAGRPLNFLMADSTPSHGQQLAPSSTSKLSWWKNDDSPQFA